MASKIYVDRHYLNAEASMCNEGKELKVRLIFTDHKPYNMLHRDALELYSELHDDIVAHCKNVDIANLFTKEILLSPEEILYKENELSDKENFVEEYYFDTRDFAIHPGVLESTLIIGDLIRFKQVTEQTLMYVEILQDIRAHLSKLTIDNT